MTQRRIILFELNEVPFRILDEFARWRPQSHLARHLADFRQFETHTEDTSHLSPWLTWPSVYRGVNDEKHQIFNFGQDFSEVDAAYPTLWKMLTDHGVKTGICGTLHTYPMPEDLSNYAYYIPDTFAAGSECFPRSVSAFQEFNLSMARQSARNVSTGVQWKSALAMFARAPELGFKLSTMADLGGQVLSERAARWKKTRRRTYQSVLAFDIFMKQLERTRPAFTTFFTNHVASAMHRFWAAAFPDDYDDFEFTEHWVNTYCREIDFAMRKLDDMLARVMRFVARNPEYALWVTTSMGQAATEARILQTQLYPDDLPRFMRAIGLADHEWETRPAMFAQANVFIVPEKVAFFRGQLQSLHVRGEPLEFAEAHNGFFSMWWGHNNLHGDTECVTLQGKTLNLDDFGFEFVTVEEGTGSNAYHIPQGCLLVFDPHASAADTAPTPGAARAQVSTLDIAPTLLANYGVTPPTYMRNAAAIG